MDFSLNGEKMDLLIQSARGTKHFSLSSETRVSEAVREATQAFEYTYPRFGLVLTCNTSNPMSPERTLASYGIRDGAVLFLTAY